MTNIKDLFLSFEKRMGYNRTAKTFIAKKALGLIGPGAEIFLGAGTTVACLGEHLAASEKHHMLKVWTNNLFLLDIWLTRHERFFAENFIGVVSGEVSLKNLSVVNLLFPFKRIDLALIGAPGISARGLSADDTNTVQQVEQVIKRAGQVVILADRSKVGRDCCYLARSMRMIRMDIARGRRYTLVTDRSAEKGFSTTVDRLRQAGLEVVFGR